MAKAPPKNPKTAETPADQVGAQQDTTAQGTNNDQAAADAAAAEAEARARAEAEAAAAEQARADAEAQAKADAEAAAAAQAQADAEAAAQAQAAAKADQAAKDATAAPQRDAEGRLEYEVVSPLTSHKRFEIGETVWLSDEEAKPLKGHTVRPAVPQDKPEAETQE